MSQAAHFANVLNAAHTVNDTAGSQKEKRFEKGMGHQMKHARCIGAAPHARNM